MLATELWLRINGVQGLDTSKSRLLGIGLLKLSDISAEALRKSGLYDKQIQQFWSLNPRYIEKTLSWLEQPGHHLLVYGQPGYPAQLMAILSPPLLLFVSGNKELLLASQIAMVGSRSYSHYGERWARYFAAELAQSGLAITSGLALGIDGICHQAVLGCGGKTIAVLGSGLANIYPKRHGRLAQEIEANGGALVSEFLSTALPIAAHFPRRNRIISGLSAGVIVIEATRKSGSLITARYALEQGREVFSLPGSLDSSGSEGTHWLIQQGANLVCHPREVIEQLGSSLHWLPLPMEEIISAPEPQLELLFPDVLANVEYEVTPIDVVAERAGHTVPEIVVKLLELELAGWIAAVPGGYVRIRRAGHVRRFDVPI